VDFSQFLNTPITWWRVLWAIVAPARRVDLPAPRQARRHRPVTSEAVVPPLVPGDPV
jgi:hypothetical protein